MKIKTFTLALLTVVTASAFASSKQDQQNPPMQDPGMMNQGGMMSPSMEDQDYSDYKEYFRALRSIPVGSTSGLKKAMDAAPQPRDQFDARRPKGKSKTGDFSPLRINAKTLVCATIGRLDEPG